MEMKLNVIKCFAHREFDSVWMVKYNPVKKDFFSGDSVISEESKYLYSIVKVEPGLHSVKVIYNANIDKFYITEVIQ